MTDLDLHYYQWTYRFIKLVNRRGRKLVERVDFDFVDELFHEHRGNRGRPLKYKPSSNLKAIIYGLAEDRRSICEIARLIDDIVARKCCGYGDDTPSHDTLSRFWDRLATVIEDIFKHLVKSATDLGITDGRVQAIDSTSIETKYKTDPDARWNYDPTRKAYYFGYGLLCMHDVPQDTHIYP